MLSKRKLLSLSERFWAKVNMQGPIPTHESSLGPCWVWTAARYWNGYGQFRVGSPGRIIRAHRLSWEFAFGQIPEGLNALHRCDNPPCVNPAHLFLGNHADNARDMIRKGRGNTPESRARGDRHGSRTKPESRLRGDRNPARQHPERLARGERQGSARMTAAGVQELRARAANGETQTSLSKHFGISRKMVMNIAERRFWKHVP